MIEKNNFQDVNSSRGPFDLLLSCDKIEHKMIIVLSKYLVLYLYISWTWCFQIFTRLLMLITRLFYVILFL